MTDDDYMRRILDQTAQSDVAARSRARMERRSRVIEDRRLAVGRRLEDVDAHNTMTRREWVRGFVCGVVACVILVALLVAGGR